MGGTFRLQRKEKEIESLKEQVLKLQNECNEKDKLLHSIDDMRKELESTIESLKEKSREYESLNEDLRQMRKVFDKTAFKGKWNIIKWLMK